MFSAINPILIEGREYLPAQQAAAQFGFTRDYIARLARQGKVKGRQVGRNWYVEADSLRSYVKVLGEPEAIPAAAPQNSGARVAESSRASEGQAGTNAARVAQSVFTRNCHTMRDWTPDTSAPSIRESSSSRVLAVASLALLVLFGFVAASRVTPQFVSGGIEHSQLASVSSGLPLLDNLAASFYRSVCPFVSDCESVRVSGEQKSIPSAVTSPSAPLSGTTTIVYQTVQQNPVVERVVERVVSAPVSTAPASGLSQALLDSRLAELERNFSSRLAALASSASANTSAVYRVVGEMGRIDRLDDVTITNSTITGGSVAAASVSGTLTNALDSLSGVIASLTGTELSYTRGTFTNATTTNLVATNATTTNFAVTGSATSTFQGGIEIAGGCLSVNGACLTGGASLSGGTSGLLAAWTSATEITATSSPTAGYYVATSSTASILPYASTTAITTGSLWGSAFTSCSGSNDKLLYNASTGTFSCGSDLTGGSGGTDVNWTFFNGTSLRPSTTTNQVLIGGTSTTTLAKFEVQGGATLDYASTTALTVSGTSYLGTVGSGTWQGSAIADAYLSKSGDWTGTLDGYEASTLLASAFATTSADYWQSVTDLFSTTSVAYWETTQNRWATTSAEYFLGQNQSLAFSTTSTDFWETTQTRWATTSTDYWFTQQSLTAASTTLLGDTNTWSALNVFSNASTTLLSGATAWFTTFIGNLTGDVTGNASTATALQTARDINGTPFDGTANITITAASSTLLANNNTWSGLNQFANATTSLLSAGSLWLTGITGSTQCLRVDTAGKVSGTGADCGTSGSSFAWTPTTNFGTAVNATSSILWFENGLFASSTSRIASVALDASGYLNFGATTGSSGYGFRDNAGVLEFKNSGGVWNSVNTATSGPSFSVHKNGVDQTGMTAPQLVTWSTERYDTNNNFASNRFTPTVPGKYIITFAGCTTNTPTFATHAIYKNGSLYAKVQHTGTGAIRVCPLVTTIVEMNGTSDYVEAYIEAATTGVNGDSTFTYFTGALIAPAFATAAGWSNDGTQSFLTDSTDLVAIGTSTARSKLSVFGDLFLEGASRYLNFGTATGTASYGLRDNSGTIEFKNSGGSWTGIGTGSGGGSFAWTPTTNFGTAVNATSSILWFQNGLHASSTSRIASVALDASGYLNFGATTGSSGYGFRDNGGTLEFKNAGGSWSGVNMATSGPSFYVHRNGSNQTITAGAWTRLNWTTEAFDTNNNFANDRFTPTISGKYTIVVQTNCPTGTTCGAAIYKNGSEIREVPLYASANHAPTVTAVVDMNGTSDYVEAYGYSSDGTISGNTTLTAFQGFLIAPINGNNVANWQYDGTQTTLLDATKSVGVGTSTPWGKLAISAPSQQSGTIPLLNIASTTNDSIFTVLGSGNVGIGATNPTAKLQVGAGDGSSAPPAMISGTSVSYAGRETMILYDPTSFGAGIGAGISFGGKYNSGGAYTRYGAVNGVKENATDGDYSGALVFYAQQNGSSPQERMRILGSSGKVGIGETSPSAVLTVQGNNGVTGFQVLSANDARYASIYPDGAGNIYFQSDTTYCVLGVSSTSFTCPSDARIKENVEDLTDPYGLSAIERLRPVTFSLIADASSTPQLGFIAQEVREIFPELVMQTSVTSSSTPDGTFGLNYTGLIPPLVKAVQELNLKLEDLATTTPETQWNADTFLARFFASLKDRLTQWFANAANGIGDFFAGRVRTKEICVEKSDGTEFCADGDTLERMAAAASAGGGRGGGTAAPAPEPAPPEEAPEESAEGTAGDESEQEEVDEEESAEDSVSDPEPDEQAPSPDAGAPESEPEAAAGGGISEESAGSPPPAEEPAPAPAPEAPPVEEAPEE